MIDADVKLGKDVKIFSPELVNIFGCEIGDGTFVGPFVEITRGTVVGRHCKIESHSFLCDQVTLEDDVFIGHGVMFTNDLYPRHDRQVVRMPTLVKRGATIGSNATIAPGVTIGAYAIVGAGAVVTKNVPDLAIVEELAVRAPQVDVTFASYGRGLGVLRAARPDTIDLGLPAERAQDDLERQSAEECARGVGDVRARPGVRLVREGFLGWILVLAAAVLVPGGDGGVVVAGHAGDAAAPDPLDGLVGPRGVAHEVAEMVGDQPRPCLDAGQHGLEGREVRVDVGDERVASHAAPASVFFITRAVFEQANEYSSVARISGGASARSMRAKPKLGKYCSAVVVSR